MFKLQHQFNNIVETTQLASLMIRCQNSIVTVNVRSVHRQLQHKYQSLWEVFHGLVDRSLWQVAPDSLRFLSSAIVFGFV